MTTPSIKPDPASFRGEFTAVELRRAVIGAIAMIPARYRVLVSAPYDPPRRFDRLETYNGRMNAKALREKHRTMAGFGYSLVETIAAAQAAGFRRAEICNITLAIEYERNAAIAVFGYHVALSKE